MIKKLCDMIKKHWEVLSYLFFGGLTTLVNWVVYFPLTEWLELSASLGTAIAWVVAVLFAFLTNKPFVFRSHDWSIPVVVPELLKFVGCRVGSGVAELLIMLLTVDILGWNNLLMKILASIIVVILNYMGSKLLVFRNH